MEKYSPYPPPSFKLTDQFLSFYEKGWRSLSLGRLLERKKIYTLGKTLSFCPKHKTLNLFEGKFEGTLNKKGELILFPSSALCKSFKSALGKETGEGEPARGPLFVGSMKETLEIFPDTLFMEETKETKKQPPSEWALGIEYQTLHPEKGEGTKRYVVLEGSFTSVHRYLLSMEDKLKTRAAYFSPTQTSAWKALHPTSKLQKIKEKL
jgi:hypothetical protein